MANVATKILVVDDEEKIRTLLAEMLTSEGYEVFQAQDGDSALEIAEMEHPDLILLDVWMPGMDGFEVLEAMRRTEAMESTPCIFITAMDPSEGERTAMDLAVDCYFTKPFELSTLQAAVRSVLRKSGTIMTPIVTGHPMLDKRALAGGIPVGSLTLIEGSSASGKSVLTQQLMSGSLFSGHQVACFTSEDTERSLASQMNSLGLNVSSYIANKKFRIQPIASPGKNDNPDEMLANLAMRMMTLPRNYRAIFVDAITNLASISEEASIMSFFHDCKNLCGTGRTVILVAHASAFEEKLLIRLRSLCDAHFSLKVENSSGKQIRILEVSKIHNADLATGDVISFMVEPGMGIKILPMNKVRA